MQGIPDDWHIIDVCSTWEFKTNWDESVWGTWAIQPHGDGVFWPLAWIWIFCIILLLSCKEGTLQPRRCPLNLHPGFLRPDGYWASGVWKHQQSYLCRLLPWWGGIKHLLEMLLDFWHLTIWTKASAGAFANVFVFGTLASTIAFSLGASSKAPSQLTQMFRLQCQNPAGLERIIPSHDFRHPHSAGLPDGQLRQTLRGLGLDGFGCPCLGPFWVLTILESSVLLLQFFEQVCWVSLWYWMQRIDRRPHYMMLIALIQRHLLECFVQFAGGSGRGNIRFSHTIHAMSHSIEAVWWRCFKAAFALFSWRWWEAYSLLGGGCLALPFASNRHLVAFCPCFTAQSPNRSCNCRRERGQQSFCLTTDLDVFGIGHVWRYLFCLSLMFPLPFGTFGNYYNSTFKSCLTVHGNMREQKHELRQQVVKVPLKACPVSPFPTCDDLASVL